MLVRREQPGDLEAIEALVAAAFVRTESPEAVPTEVKLLEELRTDRGWLPAFSLVASHPASDEVIVCTRGAVDRSPALGLGPLSVRPDRQEQGVGSALMHAVLGATDALGEPLVAVLGEPGYYGRFGSGRPGTTGSRRPIPSGATTSRSARCPRTGRSRADSPTRHRSTDSEAPRGRSSASSLRRGGRPRG